MGTFTWTCNIKPLQPSTYINTRTIATMSSPSHRRQRSSQGGTPRRSSQRNGSALPSSPPDPAAAQLHSEAASSQGNATPHKGGVPSSSPMNYRSSPADIARANRERDVSSPLRQMTNTQTTGDGDRERTPRAGTTGPIGGETTSWGDWELSLTSYRIVPHSICLELLTGAGFTPTIYATRSEEREQWSICSIFARQQQRPGFSPQCLKTWRR